MKILLPVDGSAAANEAIKFVCSLAEDNSVDVIVLMVTHDPVHYTMQPWVTEWTEQENRHSQQVLAQAKQSLDADCQSVSIVRETGSIIPCILDQAKKSKVDLIVLGAKGHSAARRVLLGSVSDSIANRAKCSVVVVRPTDSNDRRLNKILLAFDKSIASREAVTELMQLKLNRDTNVSVVSVALSPYFFDVDGYTGSPIALTTDQIAPVSETAERMAAQIAEHFPHTDSLTPVTHHVGDAIVDVAEKGKADLIVVGDTSRSWIEEFLLGSTSQYVVRHAPCSVWISRHHWKTEVSKQGATDAVSAS
jgi:nucleotide-binding universal stress UspA family protein